MSGRRLTSRGRGLQIGDGRRLARMRQMILGGGAPPPPPPPFAEGCDYISTSAITEVFTNTYSNHLTLAPAAPIGAGNYFLGAYGYYNQDGNDPNADCEIQITVDGGEVETYKGRTGSNGAEAQDSRNLFACEAVLALASGLHTYEMNLRLALPFVGEDGASLTWAALELWSFNP